MQEVVILGGGFGGIAAIQVLLKQKRSDIHITLVDCKNYHLFTPSLYEVATAEEPQKNIVIPFATIFDQQVTVIVDEVERIDYQNRQIVVKSSPPLRFDFCVVGLGSMPSFMNIPGLHRYSVPLKQLRDAMKIKQLLHLACNTLQTEPKTIRVIIGGGGFSGTELAGELLQYKNHICQSPRTKGVAIDIGVIQGSMQLLNELDPVVSRIAQKRLHDNSLHFYFGSHIQEVTQTYVQTENGQKYAYDIFVWTGGVEATSVLKKSNFPVTKRGQVRVNAFLQIENYPALFAVGDCANFTDPITQKDTPMVAQIARDQGKIAGKNIARLLDKQTLIPYTYKHLGYIVPLRGHFAVLESGKFRVVGIVAWIVQQLVLFRYLLEILPLSKALLKWNKFETELDC